MRPLTPDHPTMLDMAPRRARRHAHQEEIHVAATVGASEISGLAGPGLQDPQQKRGGVGILQTFQHIFHRQDRERCCFCDLQYVWNIWKLKVFVPQRNTRFRVDIVSNMLNTHSSTLVVRKVDREIHQNATGHLIRRSDLSKRSLCMSDTYLLASLLLVA